MLKINSATLNEASGLAGQIETLQTQLADLTNQSAGIEKQIAPLVAQYNKLIGNLAPGKVSKFSKGGKRGKFTPEQRAAISAGLKAKWAQRKAAAAAAATPALPVSA